MMIGVGRLQPSNDTLLLDDGENFVECSALAETWLTWKGQVTKWRSGPLPFCPASVIHAPLLDRTHVAGDETCFAVRLVLLYIWVNAHICVQTVARVSDELHIYRNALLHMGQRPHVCTVCSKAFLCLTDLKNHTFIHTVDRPHDCESCTKTFAIPAWLQRHRYTHKSSAWCWFILQW
jgi:hypothetical protein